MTPLEQFQKERIDALEKEVLRLNNELSTVKDDLYRVSHKITVSDPIFLKPIQIIEL